MSRQKILIVEDDVELVELVGGFLRQHDFEVVTVGRGDEAVEGVRTHQPDLVLLDIMLPGKDGLTVCQELRSFFTGPVMMLTSVTSDMNQILGLELGANDYVIKTTPPNVLLARVRAQLRQTRPVSEAGTTASTAQHLVALGQLRVDANSREVSLGAERIALSSTDFDLLWLLVSHAGQILTRDDLLKALRGIEYDGMHRGVDVAISRLRKKLGDDPTNPTRIKTVRNKGYLLALTGWDAP